MQREEKKRLQKENWILFTNIHPSFFSGTLNMFILLYFIDIGLHFLAGRFWCQYLFWIKRKRIRGALRSLRCRSWELKPQHFQATYSESERKSDLKGRHLNASGCLTWRTRTLWTRQWSGSAGSCQWPKPLQRVFFKTSLARCVSVARAQARSQTCCAAPTNAMCRFRPHNNRLFDIQRLPVTH